MSISFEIQCSKSEHDSTSHNYEKSEIHKIDYKHRDVNFFRIFSSLLMYGYSGKKNYLL
jgi:hypothetical protein